MNRGAIGALMALLGLVMGGCGVELVGGGETGSVETVMSDDPEQGESESRSAPRMSRSASGAEQVIDPAGTVSADVAVALLTASGAAVPVTADPATGTVRIASADRPRLGLDKVLVGVYPAVRVTFRRVEAELSAAILGPSGPIIPLTITVDLAAQPLVLDLPLEVVVEKDQETVLELDLNASLWLLLADPVTGIVPRSAFAAAVEVVEL